MVLSFPLEVEGIKQELWYKFPAELSQFLVKKNLDAPLVGLLFLAMKTGNDIKLEGPVSARLHYTLKKYLIPALCLSDSELKHVEIFADELNDQDLNVGKVAGTGLSCGVDSFTAFFTHKEETGSFKISHFTFLNAGSHGDFGGEISRERFEGRLLQVKKFASKVEKEVIPVDTNLSDLIRMNFQQTHTLRNLSCILNLQKLFKNYYYSSPHRFDYFNLRSGDSGDYDLLNLSMLSTESTAFFSSGADMNRIERTDFISNFPETYQHLNVCTNPDFTRNQINCSVCDKCMRTALTLDLLNKLHFYKNVFDLTKYRKRRSIYIGKIVATKDSDQFGKEIFGLLRRIEGRKIYHYSSLLSFKSTSFLARSRKIIKRKFGK